MENNCADTAATVVNGAGERFSVILYTLLVTATTARDNASSSCYWLNRYLALSTSAIRLCSRPYHGGNLLNGKFYVNSANLAKVDASIDFVDIDRFSAQHVAGLTTANIPA